jgi:pyrroline-5-carboxylate reductase
MFEIEEQAANVDESLETSSNETQPTSPVETVDQTKAFAQRLKQEKAKAKEEAKKEIAESFGYNSWQEYVDAQTNDKIIGKGMDPDAVKDVLKDLIYTNPDYVEAMKYKQEKEELEKEIFASNSIEQLNKTYGTNYKSVDELDKQTIDAWNAGTPLVNAYAAYNMSTIIDSAVKKAMAARDSGKSHLKTVSGSTEESKTREISQDELRVAKAFGLDETKFKEYVNKK